LSEKRLNWEGYDAVVVLGHPEYYPKFGFLPSIEYGIQSEYEIPDEAFMVIELKKGILNGKQGTIQYHPTFKNLLQPVWLKG